MRQYVPGHRQPWITTDIYRGLGLLFIYFLIYCMTKNYVLSLVSHNWDNKVNGLSIHVQVWFPNYRKENLFSFKEWLREWRQTRVTANRCFFIRERWMKKKRDSYKYWTKIQCPKGFWFNFFLSACWEIIQFFPETWNRPQKKILITSSNSVHILSQITAEP